MLQIRAFTSRGPVGATFSSMVLKWPHRGLATCQGYTDGTNSQILGPSQYSNAHCDLTADLLILGNTTAHLTSLPKKNHLAHQGVRGKGLCRAFLEGLEFKHLPSL